MQAASGVVTEPSRCWRAGLCGSTIGDVCVDFGLVRNHATPKPEGEGQVTAVTLVPNRGHWHAQLRRDLGQVKQAV
jgi:hypothetical protein